MHVSGWLLAGVIEIYFVLLLVAVFLVVNVKNLRKLVATLQAKVKGLMEELKEAKEHNQTLITEEPAPAAGGDFKMHLEEQLQITQAFHEELPGSKPISAYLDPKQPIQRQSLALRHAFLSAELDAADVEEDTQPNWSKIHQNLSKIIGFYRNRFGKARKQEADEANGTAPEGCVKELLIEAAGGREPDNLEVLLERYRSNTGSPPAKSPNAEDKAQDIDNLRALAKKQQKTIAELQARIASASTQAELQVLVADLNNQLSRQAQFLKESETCIQLLEEELELANSKNEQLKHQLKSSKSKGSMTTSERQELTGENQKLREHIKQQNAEIDQLLAQMQMSK